MLGDFRIFHLIELNIMTNRKEVMIVAKQFILYNLKDDVKEEDFIKFVNEYKGPFIAGLSAVKRYTLTFVKRAMQAKGGPLGPVEPPYRIAAVVDLTSLEDYAKDQKSQAYQEEFLPRFAQYAQDVLVLQADEFYDKEGD